MIRTRDAIKTMLALALSAGLANTACLSSATYANLGMTALPAAATTNVTICKNMYSQFGYCVNQDQTLKYISDKLYAMTRSILKQGDGFNGLIKAVNNRINKLLDNTRKVMNNATLANATLTVNGTVAANLTIAAGNRRLLQTANTTANVSVNVSANASANGSAPPPPANGTAPTVALLPPPSGSNSTPVFTPKDGTKVPKISPKNMNLRNETLNALGNLSAVIAANNNTLNGYTRKETRKACYQAMFKVFIGTTCIITSGAATTYSSVSNDVVTSVQISQTDAANVTTQCVPLIYPACVVRSLRAALNDLNKNSSSADTSNSNKMKTVCDLLAANPSCVQTPSSCSADIQTAIMANVVTAGSSPFRSDADVQAIGDSFVTVDASINATLSSGGQASARRLQTTSSSDGYSYETKSNAPSSSSEADSSGVPSGSVEDNISGEVPASANSGSSSAGRFLSVLAFLFLAALV